ncbi:MAG: hypothetical protein CMC55_09315 [Flavobacteriaceae bacterium]|uniref:hypothetical protein n=1 Tax=Bizionia echini TaxID=649333 RepID=UPI000C8F5616|nr:hypothetical protein [Flavobacteriaceae bacterium]|tara:strand:- start:254 stop:853 length:600 start_codon:yes stop_codon:yes gene_type:complete
MGSLTIGSTNSDITDLMPLTNITTIKDRLYILDNIQLTTLNGLNNIEEITDEGLLIRGNTNLSSLDGLTGLRHVGLDITIINNSNLNNLFGLQGLFQAQGEFYEIYLKDNIALESLNLQDVTSIIGLYIYNNDALTSLDTLENLIECLELYINGNDLLNDFCALQNLYNNVTFNADLNEMTDNLFNPSIQDIIDGNCSQ